MYLLFVYVLCIQECEIKNVMIKATQEPTGSALVLAYEHIVTQIKSNTGILYLHVVGKTLSGLLKTIFTILYGRLSVSAYSRS